MDMSVISEDLVNKLLQREIIRVCTNTHDTAFGNSPYGNLKFHHELAELCKSCNRDVTELERAIKAADDAMLHLKHVTEEERCALRKAADSKRLTARVEDLT
jgi:hypothetical protein